MKPDKVEKAFSNAELNELIRATLSKRASFRMKATGFSMSPFIQNEDILTISPLTHSLSSGEVVAFDIPKRNKLIVHRIVEIRNSSFVIKGDNVESIDGVIPGECILGIITKVERGDRRIYFGLGLERVIIAFLSKKGALPFVYFFWRLVPNHIRKFIKCKIHS